MSRQPQPLAIAQSPCDQCLFSKNRIVSKERFKEIVKDCLHGDDHFLCHKGTLEGIKIVCNGFYTRYDSKSIRIAEALRFTEFVDVMNLSPYILSLTKR